MPTVCTEDVFLELQELVYDMKEGFSKAMQALSGIQQDDKNIFFGNRDTQDARLTEVVDMVVTLKEDFGNFSTQLKQALNDQDRLEKQVQILQLEKDLLVEELERHGSVSQNLREKFVSGKLQSSDSTSTLTALLECAQNGFHENSFKNLSQNNSHTSDQDSGVNTCRQGDMSSCGEVTPPTGSPMVQSYIDSLQDPTDPAEDGYDSDSSLTAAANKSLDISRSLGDECAKMTTQLDSSDDEEEGSSRQQDVSKSSDSSNQQSQEERAETLSSSADRKLAPHERNNKDMLRSRVAREILDTERKYCNSLWTVLDHFAAPLKQAGIANSKDIATMFPGCLYNIYEHHCKFLQRLEERLCNWRWQGVLGDVLSRFFDPVNCDLLMQYKSYVKEFPASLHQLKKACRHSMRFRKFIKRSQSHPCCEGLDLASFLLTPIQRVPRYVLLFKQLLKHTEQEHPDYYHIEMALQRLGAFLCDLNNSIADSMNVVRSDTTPKPKKKIRMGSFRSSSISSYEGQHLSQSTRDSGVQSALDNVSLKSSSSGRVFQLAVFKEGETDSVGSGVPESLSYQSEGVTEYESLTLPSKKAKKLRGRERRYKTDEIHHPSLQGVTAALPPGNRHNMSLPEGMGYTLNGRPRPMSAQANLSVDGYGAAQRLLTTPSPSGRPPSTAFSDGSESLTGYMSRSLHSHSPAPLPPVGGTPRYVSNMFSASASMRNLPEDYYSKPSMNKSSLHYSMPGIFNPSDLGIFGDDDEIEHSSCQPSLDGSVTQNAQPPKLSLSSRSKSQGELLPKSPTQQGSPTQQQIIQSLARSLGGAAPRPLSPINASFNGSDNGNKSDIRGRPKSTFDLSNDGNASRVSQKPPRPRSAAIPSPIPHEKPKDTIWDESTLDGSSINITMDTTMNSTANGTKKRFQIKRWVRGKDKERRYHPAAAAAASDAETSTLSVKDKKKGFKSSIKEIFKKRSSRVMELDHSDIKSEEEETSWSSQKQDGDSSVVLVSVKSQLPTEVTPPELITYQDENGDPCSAV